MPLTSFTFHNLRLVTIDEQYVDWIGVPSSGWWWIVVLDE